MGDIFRTYARELYSNLPEETWDDLDPQPEPVSDDPEVRYTLAPAPRPVFKPRPRQRR